jgi:CBS domain-containing protein
MPKIKDFMHLLTTRVDTVNAEASVNEVIDCLGRDPVTRAVYVVNDQGRLEGIISVREVLNLLGARHLNRRGAGTAREIMATRARDLMGPPSFVRPEDDLEEALRIAVQTECHDIPVLDGDRLVGNLNALEILLAYRTRREA